MSKQYRELVGVQVQFDKAVARYRMSNYYRPEPILMKQPVLEMTGYDLDLGASEKEIVDTLKKVYAPAILTVWESASVLVAATYLQFHVGNRPDEIDLEGDWTIVP